MAIQCNIKHNVQMHTFANILFASNAHPFYKWVHSVLQHHPDGYELVVAIVHRYAKLANQRIKRNSAGAKHGNSIQWEPVVECRTPLFERGEDNAIQDAIVSGTTPSL